jgi:hypothetical protein
MSGDLLTLDLASLPTETLTAFWSALAMAQHHKQGGQHQHLIDAIKAHLEKRQVAQLARFAAIKQEQERRRFPAPEPKA